MKRKIDNVISVVGLLCLIAGFAVMFDSRYIGLTLIAIYLVIWIFLNFPSGFPLRKEGLNERMAGETVPAAIEKTGHEIDRTPGNVIIRSLAGTELGTPIEELEEDPAWRELLEEEKTPLQTGLLPGERVYGNLNMNLIASVRDNRVRKISLAHNMDERLQRLLQKIHNHYGTTAKIGDEQVQWEDDRTRLEFFSRDDQANLVLSDRQLEKG
jgi:hypothetical protein